MFYYWGFGLQIASEIEFPELLPSVSSGSDVTISYGKTPDALTGGEIRKRPFSSIGQDEYLLGMKDVCRYYAAAGKTITVEPAPGADLASVRLFLLGTVMAAILYQRGTIPFHASAIVKDDRLILFAGHSGAGKSTLVAHLAVTKGYTLFTDDICVMHLHGQGADTVYGTASYPMMKLWSDAITTLGNGQYTQDFKIRPELPKFGQFFYDEFNTGSLPVAKIFILSPHGSADQVNIKKLEPLQAFSRLEIQAYKHQLIFGARLRSAHFALLTALTRTVEVYEVSRHTLNTKVEDLVNTIEKMF